MAQMAHGFWGTVRSNAHGGRWRHMHALFCLLRFDLLSSFLIESIDRTRRLTVGENWGKWQSRRKSIERITSRTVLSYAFKAMKSQTTKL
ncbi:hypothetical protein C8R41DRAFT_326950 [Lentinula lateritia]|uniref:Secreted protein n=1 Tax=Lentinula lateritia TaxID=40482 RepID=A0ABQ8VGG7_9AGAR|nr:hypothetical protein C8R41DRAFT_326950 [Lentinula lateritia]